MRSMTDAASVCEVVIRDAMIHSLLRYRHAKQPALLLQQRLLFGNPTETPPLSCTRETVPPFKRSSSSLSLSQNLAE